MNTEDQITGRTVTLTFCGALDDVVPVSIQLTRHFYRRVGYILYWTEPIDRYGYHTPFSTEHAMVSRRRFWTTRAADQHARKTAQEIRDRVAREANYYNMSGTME